MKKRKKLTRKQEKLARAAVKDPNATLQELAVKSQYNSPMATHDAIKLPHVQDRMRELMNANPATSLEGLSKKLAQGLEAKKTQFFQKDGVVIDERTTDDNGTQHAYFESAIKLQGLEQKKLDITSKGQSIAAILLEDDDT